ncbi:MAG: hypothetical protein RLZ12_271 [Bacillota bacterium]|jgi:phosphoglucosamine mutase
MQVRFGTDGIRAVANTELTPELTMQVGKAFAFLLKNQFPNNLEKPKLVIGKDSRISSDLLVQACSAGILSMGIDVTIAGLVPTPAIAYLTKEKNFIGGIMISASHNPFYDNGIKLFNAEGLKLSVSMEKTIEDFIANNNHPLAIAESAQIGHLHPGDKEKECYITYLKELIGTDLCGLHLIIDCANGAASRIAPHVLRDLGADVTVLNAQPDGININDKCGSTYPAVIRSAVLSKGAHIGFAFDGDADRLIAVDENGDLVDGDTQLYILAEYMKRKNLLQKNTVVATVLSNLGLEQSLNKLGITVKRTPVGDRYIAQEMFEKGYNLGGEQSGHILLRDHASTGDGLLTALKLLHIVKETGETLSQLSKNLSKTPQYMHNVRVQNTSCWQHDTEIANVIKEVEEELQSKGRVLVRASGTEPLIRILIEGEESEALENYAKKIAEVITCSCCS